MTEFDLALQYDFSRIQARLDPKKITRKTQREKAEFVACFCNAMKEALREKIKERDYRRRVPYEITLRKINTYEECFIPYDPANKNREPNSITHASLTRAYNAIFNNEKDILVLSNVYGEFRASFFPKSQKARFVKEDSYIPDEYEEMKREGEKVILLNEEGAAVRKRLPSDHNPHEEKRESMLENLNSTVIPQDIEYGENYYLAEVFANGEDDKLVDDFEVKTGRTK